MRKALALLLLLAGCAGHLADYVGSRAGIVSPQLIRFGMDLAQSRCVGGRLGAALDPRRLRLLARDAGAVRHGYYEPDRLSPRDLVWVATTMDDRAVKDALEQAIADCGMATAPAVAPGVPGVTIIGPGALPPPDGTPAAPAAQRPAAWLNLGAGGSGQSIAIDASTIEEAGNIRTAWFRMTDPGAGAPSLDSFQLDIDCAHRTINAKARRRRDPGGGIADYREYPDNPLAVEGGTVMEIAFLSLCT